MPLSPLMLVLYQTLYAVSGRMCSEILHLVHVTYPLLLSSSLDRIPLFARLMVS
jgi:hypothetical protein